MNFSKNNINSKDVHPNVQNLIRNEELSPPPQEIDIKTGKGMWNIGSQTIWANSYQEAIDIFLLIQD